MNVFDLLVVTWPPLAEAVKLLTLPRHIHVASAWTSSCPKTYSTTGRQSNIAKSAKIPAPAANDLSIVPGPLIAKFRRVHVVTKCSCTASVRPTQSGISASAQKNLMMRKPALPAADGAVGAAPAGF